MTDHEDPSGSERPAGEEEAAGEGTEAPEVLGAGLFGPGGLGSMPSLAGMGGLFGEAQSQLRQAAEQAAEVVVTGRAGGGSVTLQLNGNLEAVSVQISPEVVQPGDVGMLEDLVLAALRDALSQVVDIRQGAASSLLPPGLDIGSMMEGLFGGAGAGAGPGAVSGMLGALPGGLEGLGDLMNGLLGPDGPIIDFDPDGLDDDDLADDDDGFDDDELDDDDDDLDGGAPA